MAQVVWLQSFFVFVRSIHFENEVMDRIFSNISESEKLVRYKLIAFTKVDFSMSSLAANRGPFSGISGSSVTI